MKVFLIISMLFIVTGAVDTLEQLDESKGIAVYMYVDENNVTREMTSGDRSNNADDYVDDDDDYGSGSDQSSGDSPSATDLDVFILGAFPREEDDVESSNFTTDYQNFPSELESNSSVSSNVSSAVSNHSGLSDFVMIGLCVGLATSVLVIVLLSAYICHARLRTQKRYQFQNTYSGIDHAELLSKDQHSAPTMKHGILQLNSIYDA